MKFLTPVNQNIARDGIEPVLERLNDVFLKGWHDHKEEIAGCLRAMRNNHRVLRSLISRFVTDADTIKLQGAQSFLVTHNEHYGIRVNLWFPRSHLAEVNPRYRKYLSIEELHNHDFDFFTLSLSGPGYVSRFYRDMDFSPYRSAGDRLSLQTIGPVSLAGEKVMFVEHSQDFHAQTWPASFTTTLNLIPNEVPKVRVQYVVDEESLVIRDVIRAGAPSNVEPLAREAA